MLNTLLLLCSFMKWNNTVAKCISTTDTARHMNINTGPTSILPLSSLLLCLPKPGTISGGHKEDPGEVNCLFAVLRPPFTTTLPCPRWSFLATTQTPQTAHGSRRELTMWRDYYRDFELELSDRYRPKWNSFNNVSLAPQYQILSKFLLIMLPFYMLPGKNELRQTSL
jgi:hypothetical protein